MGLITTNYVTKKTGMPMATAYAKLRTLVMEANDTFRATFAIQSSREKLDSYDPVEIVSVSGKITDRSIPLQKIAYETAKTQREKVVKYDEQGKVIGTEIKDGPLYGWDNDIVSEVAEE